MLGTQKTNTNFIWLILLLQVMSCLFFTYDVIKDVAVHAKDNTPYSEEEAVHTIFEFFAVLGLLFGSVTMWRTLEYNLQLNVKASETIEIQKGHFDEIALSRFNFWKFTASEKDVARLILRGLSLKDIAEARGVSVGTIKAQINSIFRKSKTENRAAFLGLFIDEFLEETISNQGNLSSR